MKFRWLSAAVALLFLAAGAIGVPALAQTTGSIEGTITDSSNSALPGASVELKSPNLLGTRTSPPIAEDLAAALDEPRAFVHLYGKAENRPGRKMGHVTALGPTPGEALAIARSAARRIHL